MKTNFRNEKKDEELGEEVQETKKQLTQEEFEEFISKSGARGSYMVYRSKNEDEELGIDEK